MSDDKKSEGIGPLDASRAYLAVLAAIVEELVASGAVSSESLGDAIGRYALAGNEKKPDGTRKITDFMEALARKTKPRDKDAD